MSKREEPEENHRRVSISSRGSTARTALYNSICIAENETEPKRVSTFSADRKSKKLVKEKSTVTERALALSAFAGKGDAHTVIAHSSSGCGGSYEHFYTDVQTLRGSIDYAAKRDNHYTFHSGLILQRYASQWSYDYDTLLNTGSGTYQSISPYLYLESESFAIGSGLHLPMFSTNFYPRSPLKTAHDPLSYRPLFYFKAGPPVCHIEMDLGGLQYPASMPYTSRAGLGTDIRKIATTHGIMHGSDQNADFIGYFGDFSFAPNKQNRITFHTLMSSDYKEFGLEYEHSIPLPIKKNGKEEGLTE